MGGRLPPIIETDRLRLRGFTRADFEPYVAIMAKPEVTAYLGPAVSREEVWRRLLAGVGQWPVLGYGGLIVEEKATGALIGSCALFEAMRGLGFEGEPEIGYIIDSDHHGEGFGRETVAGLLDWAEAQIEPTAIWAIIDPANPVSLKVALRAGFEKVDERDYEGDTVDVMKRPAW